MPLLRKGEVVLDKAESLGDKVVYQIYIRSFQDSNGDGIGDIAGITSRLDYLAELGIDYIWITPFFVSPQRDNGYDVANYREIDPVYGTMSDFDTMVEKAKSLGIGIMLDMVFNHTSTKHEWFQKALAGDKKYQAYYKFVEGKKDMPPTNWQSKFGGNAWEYVDILGKWYLHLFDVTQADLNWDNPEVRKELAEVIEFWKQKGVSGFRFDVVNLISKPEVLEDDYEGDGRRFYTDGPRVHEYLHELVQRTGIQDYITVGEMSSTSIDNCIHYSAPEYEELTQTFSFHHLKVDYKDGDKWALQPADISKLRDLFTSWQEEMTKAGGWNALFWSNHDQPRPNSRFGDVSNDELWFRSSTIFAQTTHMMRGTPYIYQGEELGMTNPNFEDIKQFKDVESQNYYKILLAEGKSEAAALHIVQERSRDDSRTPMQWSYGPYAGFSTVAPWIDVAKNYELINAEDEVDDPTSVFGHFRRLIELRKELPVIARGDIHFARYDRGPVISFERHLKDTDPAEHKALKCFSNFSGEEVEVPLDFEGAHILLVNSDDFYWDDNKLRLGPWVSVVFTD